MEIVISDSNYQMHLMPPVGRAMGCRPRNWMQAPLGYIPHAKPFDLPLIPQSEWQSRLDAKKAANAFLSTVRKTAMYGQPFSSRDQNGKGYCWAHSPVSAALYARAKDGQPYADLSAFAIACIIKGYRDEGGWGSESVEFMGSRGCPDSQHWAQQSMSKSNDNAATWQNAALYKMLDWRDMDPNNMKAQLVTCLLLDIPVVTDFNWWSHSVCTIDLVSINPFQTRIQNSWGDGWSDNGMGILEGSKAIPDAALCCLTMTASNNLAA